MLFLTEDGLKYMKKECMKVCIGFILIGTGMYTIIKKVNENEHNINELKKNELNIIDLKNKILKNERDINKYKKKENGLDKGE